MDIPWWENCRSILSSGMAQDHLNTGVTINTHCQNTRASNNNKFLQLFLSNWLDGRWSSRMLLTPYQHICWLLVWGKFALWGPWWLCCGNQNLKTFSFSCLPFWPCSQRLLDSKTGGLDSRTLAITGLGCGSMRLNLQTSSFGHRPFQTLRQELILTVQWWAVRMATFGVIWPVTALAMKYLWESYASAELDQSLAWWLYDSDFNLKKEKSTLC